MLTGFRHRVHSPLSTDPTVPMKSRPSGRLSAVPLRYTGDPLGIPITASPMPSGAGIVSSISRVCPARCERLEIDTDQGVRFSRTIYPLNSF